VDDVTDRVVLPEIDPDDAIIVEEPAATPVARPLAFTVATPVFDESHVTCPVRSWVVLSEYVPVAVSWTAPPTETLGFAGVIDIEERIADVTVRSVLPETLPEVAVMVVEPA
jgi:hypothetical protein